MKTPGGAGRWSTPWQSGKEKAAGRHSGRESGQLLPAGPHTEQRPGSYQEPPPRICGAHEAGWSQGLWVSGRSPKASCCESTVNEIMEINTCAWGPGPKGNRQEWETLQVKLE